MPSATMVETTHATNGRIDVVKSLPAEPLPTQISLSQQAQRLLDLEARYCVGGFTPLPGFFERGLGSVLWVCDCASGLPIWAV